MASQGTQISRGSAPRPLLMWVAKRAHMPTPSDEHSHNEIKYYRVGRLYYVRVVWTRNT